MDDDNILYSASFIDVPSRTAIGVALGILLTVIVIVIFIIIFKLLTNTNTTTCTAPPNSPATINPQTTSPTSFNVTWTPVDGATSYTLYIGTINGFSKNQAIFTRDTTIPTTTINNLALNTTYYIFVTSNNACGSSDQSLQISFYFKYP